MKHYTSNPLDFGPAGSEFDSLIRGWTQYWNDVLKSREPLDPDLVKALIASESGFNPRSWNQKRGRNSAWGLMQVRSDTVQFLKNPQELRDHLVNLTNDDMKDPNLNICAGIRWLFRKKTLEEARQKKPVTWREAVRKYKGYDESDPDQRGLKEFDKYFAQLKGHRK